MDDRELHVSTPSDDITQPLPNSAQPEQGPAENTSIEGVPTPGAVLEDPADKQEPPAQDQVPPPQDSPQQNCAPQQGPEMIVCPRCGNVIPYENFCPLCSLSLRGVPPAQPAPPPVYKPPYGVNPPVRPAPSYGYAQQAPQQPGPWQPVGGFAPSSGGFAQPLPPRHNHSPQPKWPLILAFVMGGVMLLIQLITLFVLVYGVAKIEDALPGWKNDYYYNDSYSGDYLLPDSIIPQYFIGDTVEKNGITYNFDYCFTEQEQDEDSSLIVVGVTFKNSSDTAYTMTPSLFRLEDATGNPCEFAPKEGGVSAKDVLERTVLMPGEKVSKLLLYSAAPGDYDYLPLYVLDQSGRELFYVYLSLYH